MASQYFILMTNDHRTTKNQLQEQVKNLLRERFNHTLTSDIKDTVASVEKLVAESNAAHTRCNPIEVAYWEYKQGWVKNRHISVSSICNLSIYEVKEVTHG